MTARREVQRAYPRLKREWPGLTVRLHGLRTTGLPDFVLVHPAGTLFAEVKWEGHKLEGLQAYHLEQVARAGGLACALVTGDAGNWAAWGPPLLRGYQDRAPDWSDLSLRGHAAEDLLRMMRHTCFTFRELGERT